MGDRDLRVVAGDMQYDIASERSFTFGRGEECTVRIAPEDATISRLVGVVERDGSVWFLTNSSRRSFSMVDRFGLRSVLAPGSRAAVEGRVRVIVEGARSYELVLHAPEPATPPSAAAATGQATSAGEGVLINDQDRLALVALFAGYLREGDEYDPNPKSYAAAAARLGWPRTTLVKRIEYLRLRLDKAGVPNLQGWNALNALAEYALTTGLITKDDLHLIHR